MTDSWTSFLTQTFTVPEGFTYALVTVNVAASATLMTGTNGSVSVQPVVAGVGGPIYEAGRPFGNSGQIAKLAVTGSFEVWMRTLRVGGPWQEPTFATLSAKAVFTRN